MMRILPFKLNTFSYPNKTKFWPNTTNFHFTFYSYSSSCKSFLWKSTEKRGFIIKCINLVFTEIGFCKEMVPIKYYTECTEHIKLPVLEGMEQKKMNLFIFALHLNKISCCKAILNIDILFRFYF